MNYMNELANHLIGAIDHLSKIAKSKITDDGKGELTTHMRSGEEIYSKRFRKKKGTEKPQYKELGTAADPRTAQVLESRFYREQLKAMEASQEALERFVKGYVPFDPETILASLPKVYSKPLQERTMGLLQADAEKWAKEPYLKNERSFDAPYYQLESGIYVRSHGEFLIGSALEAGGIPFRCEASLELTRADGRWERRYPDFTLLAVSRLEKYWEHLGNLSDPNYQDRTAHKLILYMQNGIFPGINLILTADPPGRHITPEEIEQVIDLQLIPMLQQ